MDEQFLVYLTDKVFEQEYQIILKDRTLFIMLMMKINENQYKGRFVINKIKILDNVTDIYEFSKEIGFKDKDLNI